MLHTLAVSNYRSLRQFVAPLGELTLITGPNGSGKSNVYRALRLLAETARGGLIASLAREGGFASTLWAGPEPFSQSQALRLGFRGDDFSYAVDLGLPVPSASAFCLDPQIKTEVIWHGQHLRPASQMVERRNSVVRIRRDNSDWHLITSHLQPFESMMDMIADPQRAAEVVSLRDQIRTWRFYDHFRTDAEAPARQLQIGTYTPVLAHDGRDLAVPALARLIGVAARSTQIFVVSHASRLIAALKENSACLSIELDKQLSETQILGQGKLDVPSWRWPRNAGNESGVTSIICQLAALLHSRCATAAAGSRRADASSFNSEARSPIRSTMLDRGRALKARPSMSSPSRPGPTK